MNKGIRITLAVIALVFGVVSLFSFLTWAPLAFNFFTGNSGMDYIKEANQELIAQASNTQVYIAHFKEYFYVIGGLLGWLALFRLFTIPNRHFSKIPKWVLIGVVIGVIAALITPGSPHLAVAPIVASLAILIRSKLKTPNKSSNLTGAENAPSS